MNIFCKAGLSLLLISQAVTGVQAQTQKISVLANKPGVSIEPTMWGIFFEDINFGADGGLYAEMVKNRSFEFTTPMMAWKEIRKEGSKGKVLITNHIATNDVNPRYAIITVDAAPSGYGLVNEGFRGMGVKQGAAYDFSIWVKQNEGNVSLRAVLVSPEGEKLGEATVKSLNNDWERRAAVITSSKTVAKAKLEVYIEGKGTIEADMISLFPKDTWKGRPGGLRKDLVEKLAELKPGFVRFPGGCIVEGYDLVNRYQWKKTVGRIEDRKLIINRWNTEFKHRSAPDYFQTFGLGFYEYFLLSEDLGAAALPILNCGMACQYNSGEVVAMDQLEPYIQDALDLIEFANGSTSTTWGKLRADMGHPAPFNLKYLGVGNEQWDEQYIERYKKFADVLSAKHPEIVLVSGSGPGASGKEFEYAWKELRKLDAKLIDEHYYRPPEWFFRNAARYDNYDRKGPKVFAGEYAAHAKEEPQAESRNTWLSALAEAAFMTGLERNADIVNMCSYAPLFAHVEAWQWRPDLIWFDNLQTVGTPNYYVQKLFSNYRGTQVLPITSGGATLTGKDSLYASAVTDKPAKLAYIKLVNASGTAKTIDLDITGSVSNSEVKAEVLSAADLYSYNTLDKPKEVFPVTKTLRTQKNVLKLQLEPSSVTVLSVPVK
ncbi:alpha-L-arabinofuranosidase C-terminal domain-containing protein [uncultured Chitinophaga sp.]|uniref:alpha-L-arabinofuranosidase C-terminal domain-containing protein n=1 Tax=uncultured Chitinophaga sp. TaxID=339340 RepID=UPI0025EDB723|nr:alpha-L-arabinofuranosidase C-terminal domain-containing protein [uncultured Chitinophaga sp.]